MSRPKGKTYTLQVLKDGFEQFKMEHGHYPSALEIDSCPYLCTSRLIQFRFGGLLKLRQLLDIDDANYALGEHRKRIWADAGRVSLESEKEISNFLINRYGEVCVHEEKKYGNGRSRVDFFVYAKETFAVEVFNTYTIHGITGNLTSKLRKYSDFPHKLFFVITGGDFEQEDINRIISRRKRHVLGKNMKCLCVKSFKEECLNNIKPLEVYLKLDLSK